MAFGQWLDDEISRIAKRDVGTQSEIVKEESAKVVKRRFDFRKLAAIDIVFLGYKLVFAEYGFGVPFSISLGIFVLFRSHSVWQVVLGAYLICLGINYVPMFVFAVSIGNKQNAFAELADELQEKHRTMSRYRRLSLLLLVPLSVPFLVMLGHCYRLDKSNELER